MWKLSVTQLIRIENALKADILSMEQYKSIPHAFERNMQLNREIISLINTELQARMEVIPA